MSQKKLAASREYTLPMERERHREAGKPAGVSWQNVAFLLLTFSLIVVAFYVQHVHVSRLVRVLDSDRQETKDFIRHAELRIQELEQKVESLELKVTRHKRSLKDGENTDQAVPGRHGRNTDFGNGGTSSKTLSPHNGIQGQKGEKGQKGTVGLPGGQGPKGEHGFTGAKGDQGIKGGTGESGLPGMDGCMDPTWGVLYSKNDGGEMSTNQGNTPWLIENMHPVYSKRGSGELSFYDLSAMEIKHTGYYQLESKVAFTYTSKNCSSRPGTANVMSRERPVLVEVRKTGVGTKRCDTNCCRTGHVVLKEEVVLPKFHGRHTCTRKMTHTAVLLGHAALEAQTRLVLCLSFATGGSGLITLDATGVGRQEISFRMLPHKHKDIRFQSG